MTPPVLSPAPPLPELFRSLADPTRLRLLRVLQDAAVRHPSLELGVGELAQVLGHAQSGVSRHLAVLKAAGLVQDRREGTSTLYRLPDLPVDARAGEIWPLVGPWLAELPEAAEDRDRLERVVAARAGGRSDAWFQEVAPRWDSIRAAQYGEDLRHRALLELIPEDLTVLDVGTGTGFMLLGLCDRVRRLVGVDRSAAMLEEARRNLRGAGIGEPDLRQGAMESLPIETASVDVVTCNMALHHAERPALALAEMRRVLAPGGRLVLTDLARHELEWTRDELADLWPGFAPDELAGLLGSAGFEQARVRPIGACRLARSGSRDGTEVDVLLATARAGAAAEK